MPPALRPLWPYAKRAYTIMTRLAAPATMRLSCARGGYLPQRVAATLDEAVHPPGEGQVYPGIQAIRLDRSLPRGFPAAHPTFAQQLSSVVPPQAVARLPQGRILGPQRAIITRSGTLVHELVRYFGTARPLEHPIFLHPFPGPPLQFDGCLGVLASRGDMNYYHFLVDVLPRLETVRQCADIEQPTHWYVPSRTPFQRELLSAMGIADENIVDADVIPHVQANELIVPTVPDLDLNTPPWVVAYLRDRLLPAGLALGRVPGRNIYVTRGNARHHRSVVNERELTSRLADLGFDLVDPSSLSVAEQIRAFAEADIIVAPHGAALANLVFASPGATAVELFPPDFVQCCYWKLAECVPGLRYRYLVSRGRFPRHGEMQGVASDIVVDLHTLLCLIDELAGDPADDHGGHQMSD